MIVNIITAIFTLLGMLTGYYLNGRQKTRIAQQYKSTYDAVHTKGHVVFHFPREDRDVVIIRHHEDSGYTGRGSLVIDGDIEELTDIGLTHLRARDDAAGKNTQSISLAIL